jgi:hypothetical protein
MSVEIGNSLERGHEGELGGLVARLIELARNDPWPELSQEDRDRIHKRLVETLERERRRERRQRAP